MSIASEITRINNNIASAYSQCQSKGATMPATQNSANLANTISTISGGGGADLNDYFNTTIDRVSTAQNFWGVDLIKKVPILTIASGITSLEYAFFNCGYSNLSFDGLDCTGITSLRYTFASSSGYAQNLKNINLANITNTQSINDVRYIFSQQQKLTTISNMFSLTGSVDIRSAFASCSNLKRLDLSNWNISPGGANSAFSQTKNLAYLDISNFDFTSNPANNVFTDCGINCLQSDGAYADGIPYVYVKDTNAQTKILSIAPSTWTTNNVVIKSS